MFSSAVAALPQVKAGRLRAIAMTGAKRSPAIPNVPTVAESGLPGYEIATWWGMLAPAGTPPDAINRLAAAMAKIAQLPDIKDRFGALGLEAASNTPDQFAAFIRSEIAKFGKLAKAAGVKPE